MSGISVCALVAALAAGGSAAPPLPPGPAAATNAARATRPVALKGGSFTMGGGERREENPAHRVTLSPFRIDPYEVTVARFASFVKRTNHVTDAETYGWSGVFDVRAGEWTKRDGATWRRPAGPRSPTAEENTPVVHVSHRDAMAFCRAEAGRLPTEAEWEYAARGGYEGRVFPWGNEPSVGGRHQANWWQGVFPGAPKVEDGFAGVAPVGRFRPNGYGLYDMVGNVWEWSADWYARDAYSRSPVKDPRGPASGTEKVIRGGSWMCSLNYCRNFRNAARSMTAPDSGLDNLGFRCAYD